MTNANIILQGRQPDVVNVLARANQAAGQYRDMQHTQAYRGALKEHGAGALQGNQQSMNALAQYDPGAMQSMQATNLNMDATRQQMKMQAAKYAQSLSQQEAAAENAKIEAAMMRAAQLVQAGDWQAANRVMSQADPDAPLMRGPEDFPMIAMASKTVMDALKAHSELTAGPKPNYKIVNGQYVDANNPQAGAQPVPGFVPEKKGPLVDMSGANFGGNYAAETDGVPAGQDPAATATPRSGGKLASKLSESDAAFLAQVRDEAANAEKLKSLGQRQSVLGSRESVGYSGVGGEAYNFFDKLLGDALPGSVANREAYKAGAVEMQLQFSQLTKGAVTENEMRLFAQAGGNLLNTPEGNEIIYDVLTATSDRVQTKAKFMEAYARKRGSLEGAQGAWTDYINANPLIVATDKGGMKINPEGDWRAAVSAPQAMDFPPSRIMQMSLDELDALPIEQLTESQLVAIQQRLNQGGGN